MSAKKKGKLCGKEVYINGMYVTCCRKKGHGGLHKGKRTRETVNGMRETLMWGGKDGVDFIHIPFSVYVEMFLNGKRGIENAMRFLDKKIENMKDEELF